MSGPTILFVADAGPQVGGGHVMRCLTLAAALEAEGAICRFTTVPGAEPILAAFRPDQARLAAASASPSALANAVRTERFDAIIFDHYGLAARDQRNMAQGRPTLVLDDLADRPLAADLVLDSGPARRAGDYDGLIADGARLLLGPQYAPVRAEFAKLRGSALSRRGGDVGRVLVSLGLTDLDGITGRVVERLRPKVSDVGIDVVLGAEAPSLPSLSKIARRDTRLGLHVDSRDVAQLAAAADVAIGAAGSSTWERCTVGLPTLMLVLADNQRAAAGALAERDAALVLDPQAPNFEAAFDRALIRLTTDAGLRRQLASASAALCDGLGAARVAEVFLKLIAARAA